MRRARCVLIRLTEGEYRTIDEAARCDGIPKAAFARGAALRAARAQDREPAPADPLTVLPEPPR